jgi:hypothetical protein
MTNEEWAASNSAPTMLAALYHQDAAQFKDLKPQLHRYFLACARKIEHLTPQTDLRDGVSGAEKWCKGLISYEELHELDWYAEAAAFAVDYVDTRKEKRELKLMVRGIPELNGVPLKLAKKMVKDAAYFVSSTIFYPNTSFHSFCTSICNSQFLCADLLREYIQPSFD